MIWPTTGRGRSKVRFYEKREGRRVIRRIVISPMLHPAAKEAAERLGVETYFVPEDLEIKGSSGESA
ncbi:MAG TPA: hypothetical protein ENJ40_02820 [Thermosulfurimonas dismutans]|uniref:Uncharacterized protein n=1 Tax=Thermosulfurimonas dismutans TaxID=999894 RepID=A0A7C3GGB3_9BACT|nr:hypothetical protein [Thermosulfurimonas dismutans]